MTHDLTHDFSSVGNRLGRYQIIEKIGKGGWAYVHRARDTDSGEFVAIKTLIPMGTNPWVAQARFAREAQVLDLLNANPHVVRLIEQKMDAKHPYMVLELLDGATLAETLDARRDCRLPMIRTISITIDVLSGLIPVHRLGYVHRDIKPENIFLLSQGGIKIIDFGLTGLEEAKRPADYRILTTRKRTIGSPKYMSPEQAQALPTDPRSDLYSVGIVLYELIVGRLPYAGETYDIMCKHAWASVPELPEEHACKGTAIERIIMRALAKKPSQRYQCANDMASALRSHLRALRARRADGEVP